MKIALVFLITALILIAGCKDNVNGPADLLNNKSEFLMDKKGSEEILHRELSSLKKSTARYHNIKNAIKDGYQDINVVLPNMGHHFLKPEYLDDKFELEKPELLVYTKTTKGNYKLVAVEYAVPLSLTDQPPEGFTGNSDKWSENLTFGLWTLHAWVWKKNPAGVFAPENPNVP